MKKSARNRIIIWSIVTVLLIGLLSFGIYCFSEYSVFGDNPFGLLGIIKTGDLDEQDYLRGNAEFDLEAVDSININWLSGNVKVIEGKGDKIKIEESSDSNIPQNKAMKYALDGKELKIYAGNINSFYELFSMGDSTDLTVTIPKGKSLEELEINSASAEVSINKTQIQELAVDSASGNVAVTDATGNTAEISTASGEITVDSKFDFIDSESISGNTSIASQCTKLDSSSVSGEINADLTDEIDNIDIESVSGNICILLPKQIDGFIAKHESVSGDFSNDFSVKSTNDAYVYGDSSVKLNFETVSGDVTIKEN